MFNNAMVQLLIELQKKGVKVHLTETGVQHFISLVKEDEKAVTLVGWSFAG